jgi:hypothetical protein
VPARRKWSSGEPFGRPHAINRASASPRFSADIDLFHDVVENVPGTAEADMILLAQHGYEVTWLERQPNMQRASVKRGQQILKVEWCHDSAFRFFPVQPDPELGYCLHPADLATNKAHALAGRTEIRDFIDIVFLHETYLSLGAICWAACGKDQGFTPLSVLDFAKRHMKFREEDLTKENLARPISLSALKAVDQAEQLVEQLPLTDVGCLYLTPTHPGNAGPRQP